MGLLATVVKVWLIIMFGGIVGGVIGGLASGFGLVSQSFAFTGGGRIIFSFVGIVVVTVIAQKIF